MFERLDEKLKAALAAVQKPGRYTGGEPGCVYKEKEKLDLRFAFCFPDTFEVGMSFLGMKILYEILNKRDNIWCERVFMPWVDMKEQMQQRDIPLYALESKDPLGMFDVVGFTLQYELSYTNILAMLDLAHIPFYAKDRGEDAPFIVAGGPCACNPEPIADFIDLFILGEGEEVNLELIDLYKTCKREGASKEAFLRRAAQIEGIYVPSLYDVAYRPDGTIAAVTPRGDAPAVVHKRIIRDLDSVFYPETFVVPFTETVHDRAMVEVLRGCIRGCRFCQAGFIYRPFREKRHETLNKNARALCDSTGFDEVSLTSLSTSDYSEIEPLLNEMLTWTEPDAVNIALPSLRVDNFSRELMERVAAVRKSSLTFAPEAGTQRLRDVINKNVTEEEVLRTCKTAFSGGYTNVKLYFMMGLPTETDEDIAGIIHLAQKVVDAFYHMPDKPKGRGVNVTVSVACFVPKPFTPFEFEPQDTMEELRRKQKILLDTVSSRKISVKYHDSPTSFLEAALARGDRRLCPVVEYAWREGSRLDGWNDFFSMERWEDAAAVCGVDFSFYANRRRAYDEVMPWDHLDSGVSKAFLVREIERAHAGGTTPHCRAHCSGCGANRLLGGACVGD